MEYIQTEKELEQLGRRLGSAALIAADTEAAGYHRYSDRVCLLQISTRDDTFVIDTLAVDHLNGLREVFARHETEVVFHDADYDLRLLSRDFDMEVAHLFDTKIAAQFIGERAFGLGSLVEKFVGIKLEKKHQRADWAQRPLPADMLAYAAEDTQHLPALRDRMVEELVKLGRLKWAEEEFRITEGTRWPATLANEAFLRLKGGRDLKPRQLAALRELYAWRESTAESRDVATFRVLSNEALVEIARRMPEDSRGLEGISGLSPALIERRGRDLLEAVGRAARLPEAELPRFPRSPRRPPPDADFETRADTLRGVRDRAADELNLDRGFLMPRNQLEDIARVNPQSTAELLQVPGIRHWQIEATGERLIAALSR
ncbi:MAG TPA: HRDC domain-containing protein [Longimicrobiales bacterium]